MMGTQEEIAIMQVLRETFPDYPVSRSLDPYGETVFTLANVPSDVEELEVQARIAVNKALGDDTSRGYGFAVAHANEQDWALAHLRKDYPSLTFAFEQHGKFTYLIVSNVPKAIFDLYLTSELEFNIVNAVRQALPDYYEIELRQEETNEQNS